MRAFGAPVAPLAIWFFHTGDPVSPFAFDNVHTEFTKLPPPNTIMVLLAGSYTAVDPSTASGVPPVGDSCIQVGFPPRPLAFERTQTSDKLENPAPAPL